MQNFWRTVDYFSQYVFVFFLGFRILQFCKSNMVKKLKVVKLLLSETHKFVFVRFL